LSLTTPFTVPEACEKADGRQNPSASNKERKIADCFFILPPGKSNFADRL
jgi:hypothetical protein